MRPLRLYINIDHVATIRQARRGLEPDPVSAATLCEKAGADGITAHLREDRRHIQDADVERLARQTKGLFNLEMACTREMIDIALRLKPHQATLVPEKRQEITTEGGLDLNASGKDLRDGIKRLRDGGIVVSLFVDPIADAMNASRDLGATMVELNTGRYSNFSNEPEPLDALRTAATAANRVGLSVDAGHGLTVSNVGPVAAIPEVGAMNIGHSVISRAVFIGIEQAVRELRIAMDAARRPA
ncbi:MAG TPA: pyridoxine 5'-phosphate synthase [Gemmatimonadaceae bacterium]|jgi:pyridoxine 5-phosphate synthase